MQCYLNLSGTEPLFYRASHKASMTQSICWEMMPYIITKESPSSSNILR